MLARASPRGLGVVVGVVLLFPLFGGSTISNIANGQENVARERPREKEQDFERLRREQLEGLQEAVWYAARLLWCILFALIALIVGMVLKSAKFKPFRPFDPTRDRKKPDVSSDRKLES